MLADGVGFEPTDACTSPVFKTGALNRSATHPSGACQGAARSFQDPCRSGDRSTSVRAAVSSIDALDYSRGPAQPARRYRRSDSRRARHLFPRRHARLRSIGGDYSVGLYPNDNSSRRRTQDCAAERSSGDAKLDLYTCAIILKRAKFEPAKWVDGSPAYAIVRAPVTWAVAGEPSESEVEKAYPPDMTLTVNQLPAGAGKRVKLGLMLAVNESGRIVGCDQRLPPSRDVHARTFPELLPIACQQLTGRFTALAAKDGSGMAVRSVQTASVVFSTGA
jgi:hypothetical protein